MISPPVSKVNGPAGLYPKEQVRKRGQC